MDVSEKAQVAVSGPIDSAGTLKYRASLNFYNTDGYLQNTYLDHKADPYKDYSGRLRLLWEPSDQWAADLRLFRDHVETTAYYYIIPRDDEANAFSSFTHAAECERRHQPDPDQQLGLGHARYHGYRAQARFQTGLWHVHGDFGLQPHQGDRHRGRLRLPAHRHVDCQQRLLHICPACSRRDVRREPEPVRRRDHLQPGTAFHLAENRRLLVDRRRVLHPYGPFHFHGKFGGPGRRHPACV